MKEGLPMVQGIYGAPLVTNGHNPKNLKYLKYLKTKNQKLKTKKLRNHLL